MKRSISRGKPKKRTVRLKDRNETQEFFDRGLGVSDPQQMLGISDEQIISLYDDGVQSLLLHEAQGALRVFHTLCALCPYDPNCWIGLGKALQEEEKWQAALSAFLTAETLDPASFQTYEEAIDCCLQLSLYDEARRVFNRLKRHQKECEEALGGVSLAHSVNELESEITIARASRQMFLRND